MPVQIGAQTVSGGAQTGTAQALSRWSSQIQEEKSRKNLAAARKEGQEVEILEDDQGNKVMPEKRQAKFGFFGSKTAEEYNKGIRDAYLLSVDNDNMTEVNRIAQESDGDLDKFEEVIGQYQNTVLANVDPLVSNDVRMSLDSMVVRARNQVQQKGVNRQIARAKESRQLAVQNYFDEASRLIHNGDIEGANENKLKSIAAINSMVSTGDISEDQGSEQIQSIENRFLENAYKADILNVFDSEGAQAAYKLLDDVSDTVPEGFSSEEWGSFVASAQTDLNRKVKRQQQNSRVANDALILQESIDRGMLFSNPNIPADPAKSSQDRKDVNNYYDSVVDSWGGSVNDLIEKNTEFVKNTGIVPDKLISGVNAVMRSGSGEQVVAYVELFQRIQQDAPNSIKDFPDESRAIALQVADSVDNGLDHEEAIEIARKNTYGLTPTQKEQYRQAVSGKVGKERLERFSSMVKDHFDPNDTFLIGAFIGAPDVPVGMEASYMSNFNDFMVMTNGNIEQSEKLAFQSLQRVWGLSEVGGKRRFMQYPPESFYHVDGFDDSWIDDQFLGDMEAAGINDAIIGIDALVSRSDSPSYPIMAPNSQGIMDIVEDENSEQRRFKPDFRKTEEYKELVSAPEKKMLKAEERKAQLMERRARFINRQVNSSIWNEYGVPSTERPEFMSTDEGKKAIRNSISNMLATEKIDYLEANQALEAYGVGSVKDLESFDIFVDRGLIRADY